MPFALRKVFKGNEQCEVFGTELKCFVKYGAVSSYHFRKLTYTKVISIGC
jgi:hypothetical protein